MTEDVSPADVDPSDPEVADLSIPVVLFDDLLKRYGDDPRYRRSLVELRALAIEDDRARGLTFIDIAQVLDTTPEDVRQMLRDGLPPRPGPSWQVDSSGLAHKA